MYPPKVQTFCITLLAWSRSDGRYTAPSYSVARCFYQWIGITNGSVSLKAHEFAKVARPVIDELYRITPKGRRPDVNELAARLYDTLEAAGTEVTIRHARLYHSTPQSNLWYPPAVSGGPMSGRGREG